jgi:hypothetical protein
MKKLFLLFALAGIVGAASATTLSSYTKATIVNVGGDEKKGGDDKKKKCEDGKKKDEKSCCKKDAAGKGSCCKDKHEAEAKTPASTPSKGTGK